MARPVGFEPTTTSLEVILSYDYPWLHMIKLTFNNSNLN